MAIKRLSSDDHVDGKLVSLAGVGIGTTSPTALLAVNGLAHITSATPVWPTSGVGLELLYQASGDHSLIQSYARTGSLYKPLVFDAYRHEFKVSGASRVNIDIYGGLSVNTAGNIDLELQSGYPQGLRFSNACIWEYKNASDIGEIALNYVGYNNGTSYYRDVNIFNGKYGNIARFQGSTGRLGIGTTSPGAALDVVGIGKFSTGLSIGTIGFTLDDYPASNQIRLYTTAAGKTLWVNAPGGITLNNSTYVTGNLQLAEATTDVYAHINNTAAGGRSWFFNATSNGSGEGAGKLLFKDGTASATRMTIDSSGNVGIGTTSPGTKLHLVAAAGGTSFTATDNTNSSLYIKHAASLPVTFGTDAGGAMAFGTNGFTERLRIDSSGNVGIGTTSPDGLLGFKNTATFADKLIYFPLSTNSLYLRPTGTGGQLQMWSDQTSANVMTWTTAGNVGIGTTSPGGKLHVVGDSYLGSSSSSTVLIRNLGGVNRIDSYNYPITANYPLAILGSTITLVTSDITRLHVDSNGLVGIGTTSPGHPLDVVASTNSDAARFRGTATGGYHTVVYIDTTNNNANPYLVWQRNGVKQWQIIGGPVSNDRFYLTDQNDNDGVYIAQNSSSWITNSDARLKDVIGPIENATAKVNALSGVKFTWKREAGNLDAKVRVGLIAQDVLEVLPESVEADTPDIVTDEETGKVSGGLGVRYTELVPLLVNAIKELTTRIATLEQRV